jgi:hypothetical protein
LSAVYDVKKWKDQLQLFEASSKSVKDLSKQQTLKEPKLAQLKKVLCKWITTVCSEVKCGAGPMIISKAKSFYVKMIITDKCTFSEGSNKKLQGAVW